ANKVSPPLQTTVPAEAWGRPSTPLTLYRNTAGTFLEASPWSYLPAPSTWHHVSRLPTGLSFNPGLTPVKPNLDLAPRLSLSKANSLSTTNPNRSLKELKARSSRAPLTRPIALPPCCSKL